MRLLHQGMPLLFLAFLSLALSPVAESAVPDWLVPVAFASLRTETPERALDGTFTDWSDEQLTNFALEADKRMAIALFAQNPEWLHRHGLTPVPILSQENLSRLLDPYWTEETIGTVWEEGARAMPELPWGFYTEGPYFLFLAKTLQVFHPSPDIAIVSGMVSAELPEIAPAASEAAVKVHAGGDSSALSGIPLAAGADLVEVQVCVERTPAGWRARWNP
ncbi:hypothetical protein HM1_1476 [Heliomicrobium modesticaldum Ice1]|uniref:Uncharacterized protein n=1 Tax=Heliobacterium modesticaldum (strain ATCC 51547 / Ice1) TaxID=498761 RepID=B0TCM3_HELMI|nr:hypothetical protein [Heliomicrobium modesticaldum]ABZ84049.1 hypothetical protein HM1_1476 [Heliomicrobium modesticaldum Ice1]